MIPRHLQIMLVLLLLTVFGMGFYALHLRHLAEVGQQQHMTDLAPVAPPVAGPPVRVQIFVADDHEGQLFRRELSIPLPPEPAPRGREILRALVSQYREKLSAHPLAEGADIEDVFLINGDTAVIDVTPGFAAGHQSGILVEDLTLASMAQTLAANLPNIKRIKLLIDGHERETLAGHADLCEFYSVSTAASLVSK